ncbi:hypothetical protein ACFPYJ_10115 [Paenibacillus solisilvae]|uniref:Transposase n=1 Tax=Paenibacillus solisilvae TaxID=2486751 RepID=A0ABW0VZ81_9BACL
MAKQRKVKKTLIQKLKRTVHSLTKPKRAPRKKTASRKTAATKTAAKTDVKSTQELQKLEKELTRKMSESMQKIRLEMEQELLEKLTTQKTDTTNNEEEVSPESKKSKVRNNTKTGSKETKAARVKTLFRSNTDFTLLKVLTLSDSLDKKVVVGYEIVDNSSQEIWGIDIHEGARLGRSKKIVDTKVKSRKAGTERQYYLSHITDDALYYSDDYAKEALKRGKLTVRNYTPGLAEAIKFAFDLGYNNKSKLPNLK